MRVAVIGARCRNQGIGAHLARFFVQAGVDVCAVLGTAPDTAVEASEILAQSTDHRAAPYTDLEALLHEQTPEVLVIATPHETHAAYLRRALKAGLHVLCEKPLVWDAADPAAEAEDLAKAFLDAGLHLGVNAQWPHTLPAYRQLFPDAPRRPRRFHMRMSPRSAGLRMVPAAIPHVVSMLHAVRPDPEARIEGVDATVTDERVDVRFEHVTRDGTLDVDVELIRCVEPPRPAAYGFDGRIANRHVDMHGYQMFFEGDGRRIPLPDPTPLLVRSFVDQIAAGPPTAIDPAAVPGMRLLTQVHDAARRQMSSPTP